MLKQTYTHAPTLGLTAFHVHVLVIRLVITGERLAPHPSKQTLAVWTAFDHMHALKLVGFLVNVSFPCRYTAALFDTEQRGG
jgi:hypothetical protein